MITSEQKLFCCFYVTDRDKKITFCSWADRHGTRSLVSLRQLVSWWRYSGTWRTVAWNKGAAGRPTFRRNLVSPSSIQSSALQTFSFVEPFSRLKYFMAPHPCFWYGNIFSPMAQQPLASQGFLIIQALLSQSRTHTSLGRSPLDECSARRRDLYLTQQTHTPDIDAPGGNRDHNLSKRQAASPRFRRRSHWNRHLIIIFTFI